tara:strand:- start:760 stop:984 length:225 start_codon:yes stop_codon:yes gene_type:complete
MLAPNLEQDLPLFCMRASHFTMDFHEDVDAKQSEDPHSFRWSILMLKSKLFEATCATRSPMEMEGAGHRTEHDL